MSLQAGRWEAVLEALERLRVAVEETEARAHAPTTPPVVGVALSAIQRRLVIELRPLILEQLKNLAACEDDDGAMRALITLLEGNPSLMWSFGQAAAPRV